MGSGVTKKKSNSPPRTDHLLKLKARLTAKETKDGPVRLMSLVGGSSAHRVRLWRESLSRFNNQVKKICVNGSHDMFSI